MPPWPNPAVESINLSYALPATNHVEISLHDVLGREVMRVLHAAKIAGRHSELVSLQGIGAGTYFVRVNIEGKMLTRKVVVVK